MSVFDLLLGRPTPTGKNRKVSRPVRWANESPRRFQIMTRTVGAIGVVAGAVTVLHIASWFNTAQYESEKAAYTASVTTPTTGGMVFQPIQPAPETQPPSDPEAAATARRFTTTWLSGHNTKNKAAWVGKLEPDTTPKLLDLLRLADPRNVPNTTIKSVTATTTGLVSKATVQLADGSAVVVTLAGGPGLWSVTNILPAGQADY